MTHDVDVERVKDPTGIWHAGHRFHCTCGTHGQTHHDGSLADQSRHAAMDGIRHQREMKEAAV